MRRQPPNQSNSLSGPLPSEEEQKSLQEKQRIMLLSQLSNEAGASHSSALPPLAAASQTLTNSGILLELERARRAQCLLQDVRRLHAEYHLFLAPGLHQPQLSLSQQLYQQPLLAAAQHPAGVPMSLASLRTSVPDMGHGIVQGGSSEEFTQSGKRSISKTDTKDGASRKKRAKTSEEADGTETVVVPPSSVPCRCRGMPEDHNPKTAYIVIPDDVQHGQALKCSHPICQNRGIRFRYCAACRRPVAKRNFSSRHNHTAEEFRQESAKKAPDATPETDDFVSKSPKKPKSDEDDGVGHQEGRHPLVEEDERSASSSTGTAPGEQPAASEESTEEQEEAASRKECATNDTERDA